MWSRASGACLHALPGSGDSIFSLAMRGAWLLSGEGSSHQGALAKVRLWVLASDAAGELSGASVKTIFAEHGGPIWSVSLGNELGVSASDDSTARVWPLHGVSARSLACLRHPAWVCSVSLAADDAWCATGCGDSRIRLWTLKAAAGAVYTCAREISHCHGSSGTYPMRVRWLLGGALVSSGLDHTVRVWSLEDDGDAACVASMSHGDNLRGLAVSQSLGFVASAGGGGKAKSVVVWHPKGT